MFLPNHIAYPNIQSSKSDILVTKDPNLSCIPNIETSGNLFPITNPFSSRGKLWVLQYLWLQRHTEKNLFQLIQFSCLESPLTIFNRPRVSAFSNSWRIMSMSTLYNLTQSTVSSSRSRRGSTRSGGHLRTTKYYVIPFLMLPT